VAKRTFDSERFAELFKALANPHRVAIFMRLAELSRQGKQRKTEEELRACVGDVSKDLGIGPSTVSHHMKELLHAGLTRMKRKGKMVECWVNPGAVSACEKFFNWAAGK